MGLAERTREFIHRQNPKKGRVTERPFSYLDGDPQTVISGAERAIRHLLKMSPDASPEVDYDEVAEQFSRPLRPFLEFDDQEHVRYQIPEDISTGQPFTLSEYAYRGLSDLAHIGQALNVGKLNAPFGMRRDYDNRTTVGYLDAWPIKNSAPNTDNEGNNADNEIRPHVLFEYHNPIGSIEGLLKAFESPITQSQAETALGVVIPAFIGLARHAGIELIPDERERKGLDKEFHTSERLLIKALANRATKGWSLENGMDIVNVKRQEVYDGLVFGGHPIRRSFAREFSLPSVGVLANNFKQAQEYAREGNVETTQWYLAKSMQRDDQARKVLIQAYEQKVRSYDELVAAERARYGDLPLPERKPDATPAYGVLQNNYVKILAELKGIQPPLPVDDYGRSII